MNLLAAWKKVLLFGAFGAVGCLAGWLVGEPFLELSKQVAGRDGAAAPPSLISTSTPPSNAPPPLPEEFRKRVDAAKGSSGDVQITLIWDDANDLDLHCVDPSGYEIWYKQKSSPSRGLLDVDRNAGCQSIDPKPVENIFWLKGAAPQGDYTVYVNFFQRCPSGPNRSDYKVNILANGERTEISDSITKVRDGEPGPKQVVRRFRVEPRLELKDVQSEVEVAPGRTIYLPVAIRRSSIAGAVEVTAENLPEGVTTSKLTIPEGEGGGYIELKATDAAKETTRTIQLVARGGSLTNAKDVKLVVPKPAVQFSLVTVVSIGVWTALLAVGLCLALLAGQNKYLGKSLFASGRVPLVLVILGAAAAGFVSGGIGQSLYSLLLMANASLGFVGRLLGWTLLGGLLGVGVSYFVPNLDAKKAALAGVGGGFLGGLAFAIMSSIAAAVVPWSYGAGMVGRFGGAAMLGFCIGLMVAAVEAAFRRAWLEVRFSEREVITVNLGPEPVKVGGDSKACTVWARGAAPIALRYWIRDGKVYCEDVPTKREALATNGDTRTAGGVTVVVRTSGTAAPLAASRATPPAPPVLAKPLPAPLPAPPPAPVAKPQAAQTAHDDYDDGLPMPMSPPPRPVAKSIVDTDDYTRPAPAAKPPAPAPAPTVARAPAPTVAKPPAPAPPKPPAPPAKPPVPTAAKPPAPASASKTGNPDACPSCGRKLPGKPGARYCMVCDKTF